MNKEFHKDVAKMGWDEVKRRQRQRLPLVSEWIELTQMQQGSRVMDIGCGPGVFVREYVKAVHPTGHIYVVEPSAEAIELMKEETNHASCVTSFCQNAEESLPLQATFDIVMVTAVLHHSDKPQEFLERIYEKVSDATKILVAEFDPEAKGEIGPPLKNRLSMERVRKDMQTAGFKILEEGKQNFEHYYFLATI